MAGVLVIAISLALVIAIRYLMMNFVGDFFVCLQRCGRGSSFSCFTLLLDCMIDQVYCSRRGDTPLLFSRLHGFFFLVLVRCFSFHRFSVLPSPSPGSGASCASAAARTTNSSSMECRPPSPVTRCACKRNRVSACCLQSLVQFEAAVVRSELQCASALCSL